MEPSASYGVSSALMPDDPSFSSYLRPEPKRESEGHPKGTADQEPEISIFDAKRYFSEGTDNQRIFQGKRTSLLNNSNKQQHHPDLSTTPRFSSASSGDSYGANYRARSFRATPTTSSEASWNSQSGLLSKPPGAISVSLRPPPTTHQKTKSHPTSIPRRLFGRKCPCKDKKSVQVNENAFSERNTPIHSTTMSQKTPPLNPQHPLQNHQQPEKTLITLTNQWEAKLKQETSISSHPIPTESRYSPTPLQNEPPGFTFPILNQNQTKPHITKPTFTPNPTPTIHPITRRASLDIYKPPNTQFTTITMGNDNEDDTGSDGSSDLFEIESISTASCPIYELKNNERLSIDTCYAPSKVSVEWYVNTVEAFDRTAGEVKRGGGGGGRMGSCRSEKAVSSVGPKPIGVKSCDGSGHEEIARRI